MRHNALLWMMMAIRSLLSISLGTRTIHSMRLYYRLHPTLWNWVLMMMKKQAYKAIRTLRNHSKWETNRMPRWLNTIAATLQHPSNKQMIRMRIHAALELILRQKLKPKTSISMTTKRMRIRIFTATISQTEN